MKKSFLIISAFLFNCVIIEQSLACYVCFSQVKDDPHMQGLKYAILFLLAVIVFVLLLLGKFFLSVRHREKLMMKND